MGPLGQLLCEGEARGLYSILSSWLCDHGQGRRQFLPWLPLQRAGQELPTSESQFLICLVTQLELKQSLAHRSLEAAQSHFPYQLSE